jgi:pimeloyl-ACP methyl ester carboxylesterase
MNLFFKYKKRYIALLLTTSYLIVCQSCMRMRMNSAKTKAFFTENKIAFNDKVLDFYDHKLHYIQTGNEQNPTLFFIHGSPGSWDAYKEYLKDSLLLKKYRMIAIDRPGFGFSNFGSAENLKTQSQWIREFIKKVDNKKPVVLIGHSMGGPVIVKMAVDEPNAFSSLVILAGSIDPEAENPEQWRPFLMTKPLRYIIPGALRPSNDELWWLKKDLKQMKPFLKRISSNVIIIHGTKDELVPYSNVAFMQKEFVNAKSIDVLTIKDANHFIPWEHYTEIRDKLVQLKL